MSVVAFLRGEQVVLSPTEVMPVAARIWLAEGGINPATRRVLLSVHGKDEALQGVVGLDIDRHTGRLFAAAFTSADPAAMEEALGLVARYAFDEMHVDRLEADATNEAPPGLLRRLAPRMRKP